MKSLEATILQKFLPTKEILDRQQRHRYRRGGDTEALQQVLGECPRGGGRRCDAGSHHRESDHESQQVNTECLVGVERGTGSPGILGDQFQIAERG